MAIELFPSSPSLSTFGLPIASIVAFTHVMLKRRRRGRTSLRTALRVLLPRRVWLHPSTLLDFQFVVVVPFLYSVVFGYLLLTGFGVSNAVCEGLTRWFGPQEPPAELPLFVKGLVIFGLYLTFEFAYWLDHFLCHKVAFLWEFHKVHHSATVLTPFANWRVHPVDTMIYTNILALLIGSVTGLVQYFAGGGFAYSCTAGSAVVFAIYMALWGHLQHSQFWISFTGLPGRLILSPAHHQIHHSRNRIHFDKNFGASLAVWDWLFGTLHVPQPHNEHIRFGTHDDAHLKGLIPALIYPFHYAAMRLLALLPKLGPAPETADPMPAPNPAVSKG